MASVLAQRREHRGGPENRRQEYEEDEIRIQRRYRHAGYHSHGEAGEHLKDRRRNRKASRERGERDDEHHDDDREDDRLEVHCGW
jgi:hypothetical protein